MIFLNNRVAQVVACLALLSFAAMAGRPLEKGISASKGESSGQIGKNKKAAQAVPGSIDINHASEEEFARLPGVGPELARRIVAYREKHGPFRRAEDLLVIRGIGPKKWKALRQYLRVSQTARSDGKVPAQK